MKNLKLLSSLIFLAACGQPKSVMETNLHALKKTMEKVDRTWDFKPFLDMCAEEVTFEATIPEGTPISGKFSGKKAVTAYFTKILPATAVFKQKEPMEFVLNKDRIIILGDDAYTVKNNNRTYRSPYAMIVTFRKHEIIGILIIQDLTGLYEAFTSNTPAIKSTE